MVTCITLLENTHLNNGSNNEDMIDDLGDQLCMCKLLCLASLLEMQC